MGTWLREPKHAWVGLASLWIIGFNGALLRFIMAFYQVQISEDLGISRGFISMAWSTNLLIAALCAPLGGWLADRYGPKNVLLASAIIGAAGTGTVVIGPHHDIVFFMGYGVIGGFTGIGTTTTYLLIFNWFKYHRAKATGILASASSLGLAISTPIFVSAASLTWKDAFAASFALGILVSLPVIFLGIKGTAPRGRPAAEAPNPDSANERASPDTSRSPFRGMPARLSVFIVVAGALFVCGFNMGTVEMNLVAIHQSAYVSPNMIALSMSVLGIMEIAGSLLVGYGLDKMNKLVIMTLLYGIRVLGFGLLFFHLEWSPIVFAVAFGITYLGTVPGGLLAARDELQGTGNQTGWLLLFHQGGGILGSLIGGVSYDYFHSYQAIIVVNLFLCALAALGYLILYAARKPIVEKARSAFNNG